MSDSKCWFISPMQQKTALYAGLLRFLGGAQMRCGNIIPGAVRSGRSVIKTKANTLWETLSPLSGLSGGMAVRPNFFKPRTGVVKTPTQCHFDSAMRPMRAAACRGLRCGSQSADTPDRQVPVGHPEFDPVGLVTGALRA